MRATGKATPGAKRPYDAFAAEVRPALVRDLTTFGARYGELPVGFDVEDFAQHGLVELIDAYARLRSETAAYNYAFNAAKNELTDAWRKANRRNRPEWLERVFALHGPLPEDPDEAALRETRKVYVREALAALPPRQRRAVVLVHIEKFSRKEAARMLGESQDAVKMLVQRGSAALRKSLAGMPCIVAFPRLRRPSWLSVAVGPRFVVTALALAVVHAPATLPMPHAEAFAVPSSAAPVPAEVERRIPPPSSSTPWRPAAPNTFTSAPARPTAGAPPQVPDASDNDPANAGGCVGDTCIGDPFRGDRVCVAPPQDVPPHCANQDVIGVCSMTDRVAIPHTSCTRHSEPTVDPPTDP